MLAFFCLFPFQRHQKAEKGKPNVPRSMPPEGRGFGLGDTPAVGNAGNATGQRFFHRPRLRGYGPARGGLESEPRAPAARPGPVRPAKPRRPTGHRPGRSSLKRPPGREGQGVGSEARGGTRRCSPAGTGCRRPARPQPAPPTPTPWRSRQ